jgi:hypothetical protein
VIDSMMAAFMTAAVGDRAVWTPPARSTCSTAPATRRSIVSWPVACVRWPSASSGQYRAEQLLNYAAVDLTASGVDEAMRQRDEFNFSVGVQFGEPTVDEIRASLTLLSREQLERSRATT